MADANKTRIASLSKRLTILYMAALGSIALLAIVGQLVVQKAIIQLEGDSRIVNIAGRQRMLSQRLTRMTFELALTKYLSQTSASLPNDLIAKLRQDLNTWSQNHQGLQLGSATLQLPGNNSQSVQQLFNELKPHFDSLRAIIETELERSSMQGEEALTTVNRQKIGFHSDSFLAGMDAIVTLIEQEARDRVNRLRWIETALLLATIGVLICEGAFIFSPAVASLNRSLTKLQSTSDELKNAKDVAENANLAKTDFLARVSHELRTPLHAILGMLGLIEQTKLRPDQRNMIRLANDASSSLLCLVDDLLDVASIEQGREFVVHPQVTSLPGLLESISKVMSPPARLKGLQFELHLDKALPNWVTIDADRLRQVLSNLLQNAIRYTNSGVVRCSASIETQISHRSLCIAIEDTGIGISPTDQDRIFASFSRCTSTETSTSFGRGMGLGLAITQAIVKNLGGTISLSSKLGQGSQFTVILPIQVATANEADRVSPNQQVPPSEMALATANGPKPTALIVDDSPTNLLVMRSYMRHLGYRTMSVSSLTESVAKFRLHRFDIVLMDRNLADGDGLDFPNLLAVFGKTNPLGSSRVFLITAEIHLTAESDARIKLFARVLHKPLSLAQLRVAIEATKCIKKEIGTDRTNEFESHFEQLKRKLAQKFMATLPDDIDVLYGMFIKGDYAGLEFISHRMIGSAGNAGLTEVTALSRNLHEAAEHRDRPGIEKILWNLTNLNASIQ